MQTQIKLFFSVLLSIAFQLSTSALGDSLYYFEPDFDISMVGDLKDQNRYDNFLEKTQDKDLLNLIKDNYASFLSSMDTVYTETPRIPKVIHQIWVGPHPFPQEALAWQKSWVEMHPDWEYKLWTNEEVETLTWDNKVYYDKASNWGEKADILRYEILYQFGGVYVDIDQSCLKSLDILHHTCDFYTGVHALPLMLVHNNTLRIANGVIAAKPGHPILKQVVQGIKDSRKSSGILARTGPDFFTKIIARTLRSSGKQGNIDIVFPANYFYPCAERKKGKFKIQPNAKIYVKPETLGIQYYTSYWITPPKN